MTSLLIEKEGGVNNLFLDRLILLWLLSGQKIFDKVLQKHASAFTPSFRFGKQLPRQYPRKLFLLLSEDKNNRRSIERGVRLICDGGALPVCYQLWVYIALVHVRRECSHCTQKMSWNVWVISLNLEEHDISIHTDWNIMLRLKYHAKIETTLTHIRTFQWKFHYCRLKISCIADQIFCIVDWKIMQIAD